MQVTRQGSLYIKAAPETTAKVLAVKTPRKTKPGAASRANYRIADKREYPKFEPGMTVAAYVGKYSQMNSTGGFRYLTVDADFFEPLSLNPQFAQDDTVIEETAE